MPVVGKFYLGSFQVEALFAFLVIPADVDAVRHDPAEQTDVPVDTDQAGEAQTGAADNVATRFTPG